MSYEALVCAAASVRPHPNADRLQLMTVHGFQVIVGLDVQDGDLGILFPTDGRLSPAMAEANDLIRRKDPITGENCGGMFDANCRVRSQRLRGERSDGFWTPVSSLAWTGADLSKLAEGDRLTELNGHEICTKYFTPATLRAMKGGTAKTRKVNRYFAEHVDTTQLRYGIGQIPKDAIVYITLKMHGTSQRLANVLDETEQSHGLPLALTVAPSLVAGVGAQLLRSRVPRVALMPLVIAGTLGTTALSRVKKTVTTEDYKFLVGTRRVVLKTPEHQGFYGEDEGFRWTVARPFEDQLHRGEILYGEVVGWTESGGPIMAKQTTKELKEVRKQYGDEMVYKYGQPAGTCKFYVYRITRVNDEGVVTELSWPQVRQRCHELGVAHVPDVAGPFVFGKDIDAQGLLELAEQLSEGPDLIDSTHIREGVVIRAEGADTQFMKHKGFEFKVLEGIAKLDDTAVDLEEIS